MYGSGSNVRKSRQRADPIANRSAHQQPALRVDVVAERQLRDIAAIERNEQPAEEPAESDAAVAFVRGQVVLLTLRDS